MPDAWLVTEHPRPALEAILRAAGLEPVREHDCATAPALVLLDMAGLGEEAGCDALNALKPGCPVLVLAHEPAAPAVQRARALGARLLIEPVLLDEVYAAVVDMMGRSARPADGSPEGARSTSEVAAALLEPLADLAARLELLAQEGPPSRHLLEAAGRCEEISLLIGRLRRIGEPPRLRPTRIDLVPLVEGVLRRAESRGGVRYEVHADRQPAVHADARLLRAAIEDLADLAAQEAPEGASVRFTLDGDADGVAVRCTLPSPAGDGEWEPVGPAYPSLLGIASAHGGEVTLDRSGDALRLALLLPTTPS